MLTYPVESLAFSLNGLQLWFNKMIPALLPFMILSGIMLRLNLTESFAGILSPVLKPVLHISTNGIYAIIIGFLCGFPMGAKVIADLYLSHKLNRREATYLLAFCNNIGPIYFLSYVLPTLGLQLTIPYLFGMYGLPFIYGIFLRYTIYKDSFSTQNINRPALIAAEQTIKQQNTATLADTLDDSILSGLYSISKLGGYMVLFNLLNLIPTACMQPFSIAGTDSGTLINCLLEITGGISRIGNQSPLLILLLLPLGGLSCFAQTYSMIKGTDLSMKKYFLHKVLLTALTILYYALWYLFSPSTFLR